MGIKMATPHLGWDCPDAAYFITRATSHPYRTKPDEENEIEGGEKRYRVNLDITMYKDSTREQRLIGKVNPGDEMGDFSVDVAEGDDNVASYYTELLKKPFFENADPSEV